MATKTTKRSDSEKKRIVPAAEVPAVETVSESKTRKTRAKRLRFALVFGAKLVDGEPMALRGRYELPQEIWSNKAEIKKFAGKKFREEYNCEPQTIDAGKNDVGYYDVQGTGQTKTNDLTITVKRRQVKYTNRDFRGILHGYKVDGIGVKAMNIDGKEYKDDELVEVTFRARHVVGAERPRLNPGPAARVLFRLEDLEDVSPDETWPENVEDILAG